MNYKYAEVKFNGGRGALLCSKCRVVIAEGFEHEDKQHLCSDCTLRVEIANSTTVVRLLCHKCGGFIAEGEGKQYENHPNDDYFPKTWYHDKCFNRYEHYYGLDKPVD